MGVEGIELNRPLATQREDSRLSKTARTLFRNRAAAIGCGILLLLVLVSALAPVLAPYDPTEQNLYDRLKPPMSIGRDHRSYLLGADSLGRDALSRLIYGARVSLLVGLCSTFFAGVLGVMLGGLAGVVGGRTDEAIMGLADVQMAFPAILLALMVVGMLGPGLTNVIIVFSITSWVQYARTLRASILSLKEREYVLACQVLGQSRLTTFFRHILPNAVVPLIVLGSFQMGAMITQEAALSFLGVGVPPAIPTWGNMMAEGREFLQSAWWLSTVPGLALLVVVCGINFLGDGLRDALDPLLRS